VSPRTDPSLTAIGTYLAAEAGSYLRAVDWTVGVTCQTCATPVPAGKALCDPCGRHAGQSDQLADRVGLLIYGVQYDSQAYRLLSGYKSRSPGPAHTHVISGLLALGLRGHTECAHRLAGADQTGWAVVPSTSGRMAFHDLVARLAVPGAIEVAISHVPGAPGRALNPSRWSVDTTSALPDHVILLDDSWVTGANAQSIAVALKRAGVRAVSTLVLGRVLNPSWGDTSRYLATNAPIPFNWTRCPWTHAACPAGV
jgi:hypothetical protein